MDRKVLEELASGTGMDEDEIRIYLKTLERQGSVTRVPHKGSEPKYRPVIMKRRKAGSTSLLDKLG